MITLIPNDWYHEITRHKINNIREYQRDYRTLINPIEIELNFSLRRKKCMLISVVILKHNPHSITQRNHPL